VVAAQAGQQRIVAIASRSQVSEDMEYWMNRS